MKCPLGVESTFAPLSTLTTSEYRGQPTPEVLRRQEIARRMAEPGAKEEVVKAISNERLEFKILWNCSLLINQLPYELLVQIFILVHSEFEYDSELLVIWRRGPESGLSKLMGTCRHWRDIIIRTPSLWCTVNLEGNINWTELCLARSVAAPIEVWARVTSPRRAERLRAVYPFVHRIRSLYFGVATPRFAEDPKRDLNLPLLFGNGMPVLENLDFAISNRRFLETWNPFKPIDVGLTSRRFPRLRSLTLAGMIAPQDTTLYTQLRTLSLTTCSHNLALDHFLDTLALCTQLEELCLKDTLHHLEGDWMPGDWAQCRPLISLPRLDRVVSSVRLDISAASSPDGACTLSAMLPASHAATLEPLAAVNAIQLSMSSDSVWVRTDRTPEMVSTASLGVVVAPGPSSWSPHRAPPGRDSVRNLPGVLPCSLVTSLSVMNVHLGPDTAAAWAGAFRSLPLLERLSIQGLFWSSACAVGVENAFRGLHAAFTSTSTATVACPKLARVAVDGLEATAVYEAIRTCVRYRRERGAARLLEVELFLFSDRDLPSAPDRACIEDILCGTERLRLRGAMDLELGRGVTVEGEEDMRYAPVRVLGDVDRVEINLLD